MVKSWFIGVDMLDRISPLFWCSMISRLFWYITSLSMHGAEYRVRSDRTVLDNAYCIMNAYNSSIPTLQHQNLMETIRSKFPTNQPNPHFCYCTSHLTYQCAVWVQKLFPIIAYCLLSHQHASQHCHLHHSWDLLLFSSWNSVDAATLNLTPGILTASICSHTSLSPSYFFFSQLEKIMIILSTVPCEQCLIQRTESFADSLPPAKKSHLDLLHMSLHRCQQHPLKLRLCSHLHLHPCQPACQYRNHLEYCHCVLEDLRRFEESTSVEESLSSIHTVTF